MLEMINAHALLIGIAEYRNIPSLPSTVSGDAIAIRDLLVDPQHCGYPSENVTVLLDGDATREAVLGALSDLAARADAGSSVLVYVSSHGARLVAGREAAEYLVVFDTEVTGNLELARSAISGTEFTEALRAIPASKALVVFDCCHSGGIGQPKDLSPGARLSGLPDTYFEALARGRGRAILSSSRDTESSYVMPNATNSLFTEHLLAGLRGGISSEDGLIRVFDLFEYLQPRVTRDQPRQHPVFKAELEENFPVALYAGGQKGVVSKGDDGFRYDAYISYVDQGPDSDWVWSKLLPRLEGAGLKVSVSGSSGDPGVPIVVNAERGIQQARRTVLVLSEAYMADHVADFENVLAQSIGVQEGQYRVIPVLFAPMESAQLPGRLSMLTSLDLTRPARVEREFDRLVETVRSPLPGAQTSAGGF
ncbi:MAG: caspase family protein [Humibacillus sp.]|nr:caspase family protein [Humibacillus sp.]MDN5779233.1 caspase family protein [Humibacillus sp.]